MAVARYLIDTSALARFDQEPVRIRLGSLVERGLVACCAVVDLEFGRSAKNAEEITEGLTDRAALYEIVDMSDVVWRRASVVQQLLAERGEHRGVGIPDLLIAATAQIHDLTVLHYDHDFEIIAGVTEQPHEWVVPRGSVD